MSVASRHRALSRLSASPFETMVASVCMVPLVAATWIILGGQLDTALHELTSIWYVAAWGGLSGISSALLWWGVLKNNVKPAIVGLRLSFLVWLVYAALIYDTITTLGGWVLVSCIVLIAAISIMHSFRLSGKVRSVERAIERHGTMKG